MDYDTVRRALKDYDPNQPRVPAGEPGGGQWTGDGSGVAQGGSGDSGSRGGGASPTGSQGGSSKPAQGEAVKLYTDSEAGKTVSTDTIFAGLTPSERAQISAENSRISTLLSQHKETYQVHSRDGKGGGGFTAERLAVHQSVIDEIFSRNDIAALRKQGQPTLIILGGRGGSGKSKFEEGKSAAGVFNRATAMYLNNDDIKDLLSQRDRNQPAGRDAPLYHAEAEIVHDQIVAHARALGVPLVLDLTMKSSKLPLVESFKNKGYRIEAHYMFLDREEAGRRAARRALNPESGRLVNTKLILSNTNNERNFEELTQIADSWSVWDNRVAQNADPKFVAGTRKVRKDKNDKSKQLRSYLRQKALGVKKTTIR